VIGFEPICALCGGEDGLDFYRHLARCGASILKNNGTLYCEIGSTQGDSVKTIFNESGWRVIALHHDLAGRPRVMQVKKEINRI
jgi:release factor glutamine methyltransferase